MSAAVARVLNPNRVLTSMLDRLGTLRANLPEQQTNPQESTRRPLVRRLALCSALFGTLLSGGAFAAGDTEAGEVKARGCMGCHAIAGYTNVYPTYHVPKLGGQNAEYLVAALNAYKSGERDHGTMVNQASSLSDQDMADIAAYFASLGE